MNDAGTRLVGMHLLGMFDTDVAEPFMRQLLDTSAAGHAAIWLLDHGLADGDTVGRFITPAIMVDILSQLVDHDGNLSSNDGDVITRWCVEGHGLIMRSIWHVGPLIRDGRLTQVFADIPTPSADIHALYLATAHVPRRIRALVDHLATGLRARVEPRGVDTPGGGSTESVRAMPSGDLDEVLSGKIGSRRQNTDGAWFPGTLSANLG